MNSPRIYIAIETFHPIPGGAETQALAHGRILRERGYITTIITLRFDRAWLPYEVMEGVPVIRVAGALLGGREKLPRFFQKLLYLLSILVMGWTLWQHRQRYDILYVYQIGLLALPAALVSRLANKPMLISLRSAGSGKAAISYSRAALVAGPLDATAPWLQVNGKTRVGGDLAALERLGKPVVRFARSLLHRAHAVLVILSSSMKSYLEVHDFILPDMQLIPNGVDIIRFNPTSTDICIGERSQIVICISRLNYEKGIDVLLQAWRLVHEQLEVAVTAAHEQRPSPGQLPLEVAVTAAHEQRPSPGQLPIVQARLIIVGNGDIQIQLEHMAKALGITDSVEFAGLRSDIAAQLHRGGLAVLPSRTEGMPNALLEAMACGLPCVATRVSGSEDIIRHEVNGLLVESEDYQAMAQALLTLLSDPALARKYGQAARATIENHYSLEHVTDMYIELYQKLLDNWMFFVGCEVDAVGTKEHPKKKPLRILMVTGDYPTEQRPYKGTFIKSQADSLRAAGLEVEIIHPKQGLIPLRYASAFVQVFLKTLTGRFDIVHGHYGLWCLVGAMQWTTPVVASFLGTDLLSDLMANGSNSNKDKLVTYVSRWLCHRVDAVIVKSEGMKKAASSPPFMAGPHGPQWGPQPQEGNIFIIPNGVDFALFRPIPRAEARAVLGWEQDRYYVLFGNSPQREEKNYPLAQAAIEHLRARGTSAELVVADGLPQTTFVQYINASNALLLPSIYEGSPNIVKEAMACNVPVVATDVGDVSQIIGRTKGCRVCPHDPGALAEALEQALQHGEPTTGRTDIAHLECPVVARQIIAVYEQVTRQKCELEAEGTAQNFLSQKRSQYP